MGKCVEFWNREELIISKKILRQMKRKAFTNGENKFRYCFHENEQALIHEMLFTNTRDVYFRPHCHKDDELQIVVDGKMYVIFFDDNGKILKCFFSSKNRNSIYRINKDMWHMNLPITKTITILEIKQGPFLKDSNIYPIWAPVLQSQNEIKKYYANMKSKIRRWRIKNV